MDDPMRQPWAARLNGRLIADLACAPVYGVLAWGLLAHSVVSTGLAVSSILTACLALVIARHNPAPGLGFALVGFWLSPLTDLLVAVSIAPTCWALYFAAVALTRRAAVLALAVAAASAVFAGAVGGWLGAAVFAVLGMLLAWTVGILVSQASSYDAELRDQDERIALAELEIARRGVVDERMRIARELHDVLAHSISMMTVQAAYGRVIIDSQPDQARASLSTIESAGRETLVEIRRVLDVLRDESATEAQAAVPVPGLADLEQLISHAAQSGVAVELCQIGEPRPLPPSLDITAYRIVQEALTNVIRHAHTSTANVTIEFAPAELTIAISDHGVGGSTNGELPSGHGLLGMRERIDMYGGELTVGPLPEGGFRVTARLPTPLSTSPAPAGQAG